MSCFSSLIIYVIMKITVNKQFKSLIFNFNFQDDTSSVISFTSSIHSLNDASMSTHRRREDIDTKIEFGNSLMELFGSNDADKMSRTFLAMSSSPANCDNVRICRTLECKATIIKLTYVIYNIF